MGNITGENNDCRTSIVLHILYYYSAFNSLYYSDLHHPRCMDVGPAYRNFHLVPVLRFCDNNKVDIHVLYQMDIWDQFLKHGRLIFLKLAFGILQNPGNLWYWNFRTFHAIVVKRLGREFWVYSTHLFIAELRYMVEKTLMAIFRLYSLWYWNSRGIQYPHYVNSNKHHNGLWDLFQAWVESRFCSNWMNEPYIFIFE